MPPLPISTSDVLTLILTFLRTIYDLTRGILNGLLQDTLFKAKPELADTYSDAITLLITLTTLYLLLVFVAAAKKFIRIILILGWALLLLAFIMSSLG